jgi:HK97 family phage major capsid protein
MPEGGSNIMSTASISPGLADRLRGWGVTDDQLDAITNVGPVRNADAPPVPKNADELAEFMGDPGRFKPILSSADSLREFITAYAREQQGEGTDLAALVRDESTKVLTQLLKDNAQDASRDAVRRLNLDPQNHQGRRGMLSGHRQATAYNPRAMGARLDSMFTDLTDYASTVWHLNPDPKAAAKRGEIVNAFGSVVPADGGFLVPENLRAQLLEVALETAIVRSRATVVPMESPRVPFPVLDSTSNASSVFGGMIAYWAEEGSNLTDASAKFGRITLDAKKLTGLSAVPNELLQDSLISFAALIERLWPEAIAWYEDVAFMGGSGVGEPLGFIGASNPAAIGVAAEAGQASGTIVYENIVKMYSRMLPSSLNRAVWICSPDAIPELFTMALSVGTGGNSILVANAQGPAPITIFNRPLIVSEKSSTVGTRGDIDFVDLAYYLVGDRQVMSMESSKDFNFGSDKTTFRIIQRVDGRPWLQSAITPKNGSSNTLSPFVELATR